MKELRDKVAVITGAASGIGRATARRLGAQGMKLVVADVEGTALQETAHDLRRSGFEAHPVVADVTQADAVQGLARETLDSFGAVHVVFNNAGVFAGGTAWETTLADYEWVLGVNLWGVIHGLRSFVPILLEQGEPAHVVNTASMAAVTSAPLSGAYVMSKHAVLALSESLYHELRMKQAPIGVSVICPELIATGIGRSERNRPVHLKRSDGPQPAETEMVEDAIRTATAGGADPDVIAQRTLEAIREDRFYVLAPEGDPWRRACDLRLEDLRLARNPSQGGPVQ
ncbi:MAG: 3-oxoacyl-ACP reductase [Deltaproteobacteria bacterium]|jgi:NAD(P)-dependent dehydrogenase (short-subunit alcohol dehydrogenase family)|nr:3-oxoacyl-ACP reductase [Deltaproteobacteria bacterium]